jgi:hypothetical protein
MDPATLVVPPGGRIVLAEAEQNLFGYRMMPLPRRISLPESISAVPVEETTAEGDLQKLVAAALEKQPAAFALVFVPHRTVEQHYNPYRVFLGWRTESVVDGYENGRAVTRKREVPRFQTRYRHQCVRIGYRVFQYGPDAAPMGRVEPRPRNPLQCPEKSDAEVVIDEFDAAARWLKEHIRVR